MLPFQSFVRAENPILLFKKCQVLMVNLFLSDIVSFVRSILQLLWHICVSSHPASII